MKTKQELKKKTRKIFVLRSFFCLLGLFVVNRTANSPNKSCVLRKYITTMTFHVSSLAEPSILSSAFRPNW